ncbi:hypothetical protein [Fusobacterium sp.]|uniref:hypothetical protein n=1 Tax=Fusobacterium sp. TaxID=68766 RepID=UPI0028FFE965|nr:hypothetical protein [Fusobacterium sp.]MDU1912611.1 hypothetical protein [Fusobacterium sp.]
MKKIIRKNLENLILKNKIENTEKKSLDLLKAVYHCLGKEKKYILEYRVIQDMNFPYETWKLYIKKEREIEVYVEVLISKIIPIFTINEKAIIIDENPESIKKNVELNLDNQTFTGAVYLCPKIIKVMKKFNYIETKYIDLYMPVLKEKNKKFSIINANEFFTLEGLFFIDYPELMDQFVSEDGKSNN